MINLKTGKFERQLTGNNLWHTEDGICIESSMGYTEISADHEVRKIFASFLRNTFNSNGENTDIDFIFENQIYRLAVAEDCPDEGPINIYMIFGPAVIILQLDWEVFMPLAEYLEKADES